jgi:hypothetical protein
MTWLRLWSSSTKDESCGRSSSPRRVIDQANKRPDEPLEAACLGLFPTTSAAETPNRNVFTEPETIGAALALTAAILGSRRIYKRFLKRIPEAVNIKSTWLGRRSILGKVTSVGWRQLQDLPYSRRLARRLGLAAMEARTYRQGRPQE